MDCPNTIWQALSIVPREHVCFHAAHSGLHEFNLENYSVERLTHVTLEPERRRKAT